MLTYKNLILNFFVTTNNQFFFYWYMIFNILVTCRISVCVCIHIRRNYKKISPRYSSINKLSKFLKFW